MRLVTWKAAELHGVVVMLWRQSAESPRARHPVEEIMRNMLYFERRARHSESQGRQGRGTNVQQRI